MGFCASVVRLFQGLSLISMTPNRSISSIFANSSCCFAGETGKNLSFTGTAPSTNWIECSSTLLLSLLRGSNMCLYLFSLAINSDSTWCTDSTPTTSGANSNFLQKSIQRYNFCFKEGQRSIGNRFFNPLYEMLC
ncbi:uncharacterized protein [Drosophila suzukii]|uniref:Uncharacterized protein isoform X1 n=1 Tax=Drosophila suzukii TaxID=28584 RepID=A0ABM4TZQ9_DROSZ